jgi:hypothetical protein
MNQSREAHHPARPLHSPEGPTSAKQSSIDVLLQVVPCNIAEVDRNQELAVRWPASGGYRRPGHSSGAKMQIHPAALPLALALLVAVALDETAVRWWHGGVSLEVAAAQCGLER